MGDKAISAAKSAKATVRRFRSDLAAAPAEGLRDALASHFSDDFCGYASHPWRELAGAEALTERLLCPLLAAFTGLQRREDIFFAGMNPYDKSPWVLGYGHLMGLFDRPWLDIPPTGKLSTLRYAEFHRVTGGKISRAGIFFDLIGFMRQAGFDPLPEETGRHFVYPGPLTHDGIVLDDQDPGETKKTADLVETMVRDLDMLNQTGNDDCPPELLAKTWHEDMVWYGPAGIGASATIRRYQEHHQLPFRKGLKNKQFNGHTCRIAEGNYAAFFGWPNLRNSPAGFLGTESSDQLVEMQVVDIYRRAGDKLAENWVIIDLPYWLHQQGIDVFASMRDHFNKLHNKFHSS